MTKFTQVLIFVYIFRNVDFHNIIHGAIKLPLKAFFFIFSKSTP